MAKRKKLPPVDIHVWVIRSNTGRLLRISTGLIRPALERGQNVVLARLYQEPKKAKS